ncbi:MAG TPA: MBL fold metallo-hydrolase [Polyangiales bacterium]|nr:MBL fold metallo-hydrolase [Polyangiales bacterium]
MEFQVISHACVAIRHADIELLIDPWLVGSCYWRSWWNFPEPPVEAVDALRPSFICITHLHWDHFHGPSLRRFPRTTKLVVPKLPTSRRMVEDLQWLGFKDVTELAHGETLDVGRGLKVTSYQSGFSSDSMLVISNGRTTIVNANDCKMFGRSLDLVRDRFPNIDFVLRSHSSATPIPYCIESYPRRFSDVRSVEDYAEEFARFALYLGAAYAIPFASNHCYLHRETYRYNALATDPQCAHDTTNREAERLGLPTRAVTMPAGSRWSEARGFELVKLDYNRRDQHIEELVLRHRETLSRSYAEETAIEPDAAAGRRYFEELFRGLPPSWLTLGMFDFVIQLEIVGATKLTLLLDFGAHALELRPAPTPDITLIRIPARVFNECCNQRMFSTWSASKRLAIHVPDNMNLGPVVKFLTLLDFFELGVLPLQNNFSLRSLRQRLLRWREVLDFASYFWQTRTRRDFRIRDLYPIAARPRNQAAPIFRNPRNQSTTASRTAP